MPQIRRPCNVGHTGNIYLGRDNGLFNQTKTQLEDGLKMFNEKLFDNNVVVTEIGVRGQKYTL